MFYFSLPAAVCYLHSSKWSNSLPSWSTWLWSLFLLNASPTSLPVHPWSPLCSSWARQGKPLHDLSPEDICISVLPAGVAIMITRSKIALFISQPSLNPYYVLFTTTWHYMAGLFPPFIHTPPSGWHCVLLSPKFSAPKSVPGTWSSITDY